MEQHLKELEKAWSKLDDAKKRLHKLQRELEHCNSCRFWRCLYEPPMEDANDPDADNTGECRRYPPTEENSHSEGGSFFRLTYESTWCGEYQRKIVAE